MISEIFQSKKFKFLGLFINADGINKHFSKSLLQNISLFQLILFFEVTISPIIAENINASYQRVPYKKTCLKGAFKYWVTILHGLATPITSFMQKSCV